MSSITLQQLEAWLDEKPDRAMVIASDRTDVTRTGRPRKEPAPRRFEVELCYGDEVATGAGPDITTATINALEDFRKQTEGAKPA